MLEEQYIYDEIIYMTPDGELFTQKTANILSLQAILLFYAVIIKEWMKEYASILLPEKSVLAIMYCQVENWQLL
jgi:hypothetical protein